MIEATGAQLLIHELDAQRLGKVLHNTFSRLLGGKGSPRPDVLLHDDDMVRIGETQLKVLHTPGHTPGGVSLLVDAAVFVGDTLFQGSIGRTDCPGGSFDTSVILLCASPTLESRGRDVIGEMS